MANPTTLVTVHGEGTAQGPTTNLHLTLSGVLWDKTTAAARQKAKARLAEVRSAIIELCGADAGIDESRLNSYFHVRAHVVDSGREGFDASFTLQLVSNKPEAASVILDRVAEIEGIEVSSPSFSMRAEDERELKNQAFVSAVAAAKARFRWQCSVIGLDPSDFIVSHWTYSSGRSASAGKRLDFSDDGHVSLASRAAQCQVRIDLTYAW
jgi:uncharacterized protein YggE